MDRPTYLDSGPTVFCGQMELSCAEVVEDGTKHLRVTVEEVVPFVFPEMLPKKRFIRQRALGDFMQSGAMSLENSASNVKRDSLKKSNYISRSLLLLKRKLQLNS